MRTMIAAAALVIGGCATPCINGSIDLHGKCGPVDGTAECAMRQPGERCLDTGTCNVKGECDIPGGAPVQ